jgi:hypothetical protein
MLEAIPQYRAAGNGGRALFASSAAALTSLDQR